MYVCKHGNLFAYTRPVEEDINFDIYQFTQDLNELSGHKMMLQAQQDAVKAICIFGH